MITPLDSVTDGARPPGSTSSDPAARHAGARFQTLVEQLPAIVWTATLDNVTTYVSPQVERILGTPVDIWLSDPNAWERHIHPADRERVAATLAAARHADVPFRAEYRLV